MPRVQSSATAGSRQQASGIRQQESGTLQQASASRTQAAGCRHPAALGRQCFPFTWLNSRLGSPPLSPGSHRGEPPSQQRRLCPGFARIRSSRISPSLQEDNGCQYIDQNKVMVVVEVELKRSFVEGASGPQCATYPTTGCTSAVDRVACDKALVQTPSPVNGQGAFSTQRRD